MCFQSKQFYFQENMKSPETKTDLFSANQIHSDDIDILIKTFDIKMPRRKGYTAYVEGWHKPYRLKVIEDKLIFSGGYNIGIPYKIESTFNDGNLLLYGIQIYTKSREKLLESLIKYYEAYLNLGIIVIRYINYYFSTNDICYKNEVIIYN